MTDERLELLGRHAIGFGNIEIAELVAEIRRLRAEVEAMRPGAEAWEIVRHRKIWVVPTSNDYWRLRFPYGRDYTIEDEKFTDPVPAVHVAEKWLKEQEASQSEEKP